MGDEILLELFEETGEATPDETDSAARSLRRDLLDLEVVGSVGPASAGPPPEGARGLDLSALGALLVSAQPTVAVLTKVFGVLRDWMSRRSASLRVTVNGQSIELTPTTAQQDALVQAFISQVGAKT